MKIFADNFAISFELKQVHRHFAFETHELNAISMKLLAGPLLFPNQVFYTDSEGLTKKLLLQIHRDPKVRKQRAHLIILFPDQKTLEKFQGSYLKDFKKIVAAGGLVVNNHDELLTMIRDAKWDLPKGKLEPGESLEEGALREVEEETGIKGHEIIDLLTTTYHIFHRREKWRFKTTYWYRMKSMGRARLDPQTEEGITHASWIPIDELRDAKMKTYPQIMELIALICATHHPIEAS